MDVNIIWNTIEGLTSMLTLLVVIGLFVIQYAKETWSLEGKNAEILSLVVGFILSFLVAWVYVDALSYILVVGQWVGVVLFLVIGTIGPSGGYKVLGILTGVRNNGNRERSNDRIIKP